MMPIDGLRTSDIPVLVNRADPAVSLDRTVRPSRFARGARRKIGDFVTVSWKFGSDIQLIFDEFCQYITAEYVWNAG